MLWRCTFHHLEFHSFTSAAVQALTSLLELPSISPQEEGAWRRKKDDAEGRRHQALKKGSVREQDPRQEALLVVRPMAALPLLGRGFCMELVFVWVFLPDVAPDVMFSYTFGLPDVPELVF